MTTTLKPAFLQTANEREPTQAITIFVAPKEVDLEKCRNRDALAEMKA